MEDTLFLIGFLFLLSFPGMAIVGFVYGRGAARTGRENTDQIHRLERILNLVARRLDEVETRLAAVEAGDPRPAGEPAATPAPETAPSETPEEAEAARRRRAAAELDAAARRPREDTSLAARSAPAAGEASEPVADGVGADEAAAAAADGPVGPAAAAPPAEPARGLEEMLGTRWTVWVGGLALALGGIFLVRYSIEQGYFGPAARLAFASLFSALLLAAGEYLRRNELKTDIVALPTAHIPGVLTAAGTVAAFATVYGAHALYEFIGPATAFLALGVVGVATMALAVLHGPWLAVLGVLGAFATPVLVESSSPNVPALVIYLLFVTAAAFGIARLRLWRWVAAAAFAAAFAWAFPILGMLPRPSPDAVWFAAYVIGLLGLVAGILVLSIHGTVAGPEDRPTDRFAVTALSLVAFLAFAGQLEDDHGLIARLLALATVLTLLGLSWRVPAVAPAALTAGLFAVGSVFFWQIHVSPAFWSDTFAEGADGLVTYRPRAVADFLGVVGTGGLLLLAAGYLGAERATPRADRQALWFALAGTLSPVLLLATTWIRVAGFEQNTTFAAAGLGLAALFGAATGRLARREGPDRPSLAVAVYAVGTVGALGAALAIGLDRGALTVALAMLVPALAWVHASRPIPTLRPLAVVVGLVVLARVAWDPRIVGEDLGTTPIFNWLLYGYGIPAFGFAFAAWTFRRSGDDVWQRGLEGLAVAFAGLLGIFEIRHLVNHGEVFAPTSSLAEAGLFATLGFVMSAALTRIAGRLGSAVYDGAAMVATVVGVLIAASGLLVLQNPMLTADSVGEGLVLNLLLLGYLLPALAAALAARLARPPVRPLWFYRMLAATALVLGFAWATLMVRRVYHGPVIALGAGTDAELWTYSAVWLIFGLGLLVGGLLMASQPARLASAAILVLTILKVFLIDMAELTGLWRALSFIALGLVLVGIGMLYQRLLFPPKRGQGTAEAEG